MKRMTHADSICPIARSLDILGDWWNPLIIRECLYGVHRFDGFQRWLGIGRNILSNRLQQLVEGGILETKAYQEKPRRLEYHLTAKGRAAAVAVMAMFTFGRDNCFQSQQPTIRLYDQESDEEVEPVLVDRKTGKEINPQKLYAGPGPKFPKSSEIRRARFTEFYTKNKSN